MGNNYSNRVVAGVYVHSSLFMGLLQAQGKTEAQALRRLDQKLQRVRTRDARLGEVHTRIDGAPRVK